MSIETGRAYLRARGYEDRIQEFSVFSATVELAAQAVGCEPARIAKTLSFAVGRRCSMPSRTRVRSSLRRRKARRRASSPFPS
ncbi:hypothetical protein NE659_25120, partial [Flavonifractor plautii]|nr:hypothetical protein [Flavonifractor plautii]